MTNLSWLHERKFLIYNTDNQYSNTSCLHKLGFHFVYLNSFTDSCFPSVNLHITTAARLKGELKQLMQMISHQQAQQ